MSYTIDKFTQAIRNLKSNAVWSYCSDGQFAPSSEEEFNNIEWVTGEDENGSAITTNTCPHSEITWTLLKQEMDKL
tara:strand:- start:122 stop:349 length:228 start_codon:yes stop_codon:yes gene_type:complete